jgi:hypothetical protein
MTAAYIVRHLHVSIPHIKLNYMQGHENNLEIYSSPRLHWILLVNYVIHNITVDVTQTIRDGLK